MDAPFVLTRPPSALPVTTVASTAVVATTSPRVLPETVCAHIKLFDESQF
jgi:hypothetical protein